MKIIVIGINFGNYEKRIVEEMEKQGHDVFYMHDSSNYFTIYKRFLGDKIASGINRNYWKKMIRKMPNDVDRVVVIVGRQLDKSFYESIKSKNPNAVFTLYLWDDVKRVANFEDVKLYFNDIYSFDLKDCQKKEFKHLPLFFSKRPLSPKIIKYDIYSAMFSHSERESIVKAISKQADTTGMKCRFYISLGRFAYFKRNREIKANIDDNITYISKPIAEEYNYENMNHSKAILDIQFSSQIGLTMRTIESLGMKNKLITTNTNIKYYDFYNPNNILIIDRVTPLLTNDFLQTSYEEIDETIYEKYSINTWVKTLIGTLELNNYLGNYDINTISFGE